MGGAKVVHALGAWATAAGCPLHPEARWGGGLTALHVATLLREPEEVALALTGAGMGCADMLLNLRTGRAVCVHVVLPLQALFAAAFHRTCFTAPLSFDASYSLVLCVQACARPTAPSSGQPHAARTARRRRWAWPAA